MTITLPVAPNGIAGLEHLQYLQYAFLAPNALLFYDHALTFASEVEQIWCRKLTLQSFLFLLLRYISPLQAIFFSLAIFPFASTLPCTILIRVPPVLAIVQTAIIGGIMILRIYALYERNKHVTIILLLLLGGQVIVMAVLTNGLQYSMGTHGCIALTGGSYITFFWWSPIVLDTIIFLLTILRLHHFRKIRERVSIFRILLRDGIMYYVIICSLNMINALFFLFAKADLKLIGVSLGSSVSATITSRLVLNLHDTQPSREAAELRNSQTEQDGVLTTIPPIYVTPESDLDTYSLHDIPHHHHDNNSWYSNETSDLEDARKDGELRLGTKVEGSPLHTSPFSYNITEWT